MRKKYQIVNIMFYFSVVIVSSTFAGGNKLYLREQRSIADNAFALVLAECDAKIAHGCFYVKNPQFSLCFKEKDLWHSKTFGEISANFSKGRFSYSRFHKRGQTVFNQLKALSCDHLKKVYQEHGTKSIDAISRGDWSKVSSATQVNQNVVVNYFVHHYLALQFAKTAGETEESGKEDLRRALVYEARAQSYLRNAFYAGHMLVPIYYPLFALHSRNIREAHDFYRNTGVFVINARGDAWQTFGGAILQTHEPTYRYILEASLTSLRELFLVYYTSISDGTIPKYLISDEMPLERLKKRVIETWTADGYYRQIFFGYYASIGNGTVLKRFIPEDTPVEKIRETIKKWTSIEKIENYYSNDTGGMPTLLLLPMPISATWSERLPEKDDHDIHRRFHYPQLRDEELHDPSLKNKPLYAKKDVPQWLIPMQLTDKDADYLIKMHPNFASVHYTQDRSFPPSFRGLLLLFGSRFSEDDFPVGLGYGLIDAFGPLNNVSVEVSMIPAFKEARRFLAALKLGGGIKLPASWPILDGIHLEGGYVRGLRNPFEENGGTFAAGIATKPLRLGFTYAGATIRLKYQWFWMEETLEGPFFEVVFH